MDPNAAAALGAGGAAVAAQPNPDDNYQSGPGFPPIPVLIIWLATLGVAIWILTKNNRSHTVFVPVSSA